MKDILAGPVGAPPDETALEAWMSEPSPRAIEVLRKHPGDIVVLGAAGKVGITLAMMLAKAAKAAGTGAAVRAVSRFSDRSAAERMEDAGVEVVKADLLDSGQVDDLPEAANVFFLAGRKFGTTGAKELTWATNVLAPDLAARRYRGSRIVAYSTGCVYDFVPAASGGSVETDEPRPTGEYAQSALGRERVFEYHSRAFGTPVCLFRLNYAVDLRYGVLRDVADKVFSGQPVDLGAGNLNCIWQGDVLERTILCLEICSSPPRAINITGPETVSVRYLAKAFGARFGKPPVFQGEERPDTRTYLSNAAVSFRLFGYPRIGLEEMIDLTAEWMKAGGSSLGKPTHFEVKDGTY
ncbi:MAG TPA: NAD(P)-dependent oxidoreductase [Rectinemataceae bacterium]